MFYRPENGHGLPHNPFKAVVSPRPIGWISTRSTDGVNNLAPYSFFNGVADAPPQVMFSTTGTKPAPGSVKDSLTNIRETGVFCANIVEFAMMDKMNITTEHFDAGEDEFAKAGLQAAPCETINCAWLATAPAALECKLTQIVELPGKANTVVFGEVTGIHLRDNCIVDGRFDVTTYQPLARLGYRDYARVSEVFELARPDD